jgi:hypothetical protein
LITAVNRTDDIRSRGAGGALPAVMFVFAPWRAARVAVRVHGGVDYLFYSQYGTYGYRVRGLLRVSSAICRRARVAAGQIGNTEGHRRCA